MRENFEVRVKDNGEMGFREKGESLGVGEKELAKMKRENASQVIYSPLIIDYHKLRSGNRLPLGKI